MCGLLITILGERSESTNCVHYVIFDASKLLFITWLQSFILTRLDTSCFYSDKEICRAEEAENFVAYLLYIWQVYKSMTEDETSSVICQGSLEKSVQFSSSEAGNC